MLLNTTSKTVAKDEVYVFERFGSNIKLFVVPLKLPPTDEHHHGKCGLCTRRPWCRIRGRKCAANWPLNVDFAVQHMVKNIGSTARVPSALELRLGYVADHGADCPFAAKCRQHCLRAVCERRRAVAVARHLASATGERQLRDVLTLLDVMESEPAAYAMHHHHHVGAASATDDICGDPWNVADYLENPEVRTGEPSCACCGAESACAESACVGAENAAEVSAPMTPEDAIRGAGPGFVVPEFKPTMTAMPVCAQCGKRVDIAATRTAQFDPVCECGGAVYCSPDCKTRHLSLHKKTHKATLALAAEGARFTERAGAAGVAPGVANVTYADRPEDIKFTAKHARALEMREITQAPSDVADEAEICQALDEIQKEEDEAGSADEDEDEDEAADETEVGAEADTPPELVKIKSVDAGPLATAAAKTYSIPALNDIVTGKEVYPSGVVRAPEADADAAVGCLFPGLGFGLEVKAGVGVAPGPWVVGAEADADAAVGRRFPGLGFGLGLAAGAGLATIPWAAYSVARASHPDAMCYRYPYPCTGGVPPGPPTVPYRYYASVGEEASEEDEDDVGARRGGRRPGGRRPGGRRPGGMPPVFFRGPRFIPIPYAGLGYGHGRMLPAYCYYPPYPCTGGVPPVYPYPYVGQPWSGRGGGARGALRGKKRVRMPPRGTAVLPGGIVVARRPTRVKTGGVVLPRRPLGPPRGGAWGPWGRAYPWYRPMPRGVYRSPLAATIGYVAPFLLGSALGAMATYPMYAGVPMARPMYYSRVMLPYSYPALFDQLPPPPPYSLDGGLAWQRWWAAFVALAFKSGMVMPVGPDWRYVRWLRPAYGVHEFYWIPPSFRPAIEQAWAVQTTPSPPM